MAEVLLEQVGKTYGSDIRAVETMDLSIGDGEFLVNGRNVPSATGPPASRRALRSRLTL